MEKRYKIRRTDTNQYWTGYGNTFSKSGTSWRTAESAANELANQLRWKHVSILTWLDSAEVVEYEVVENEASATPAQESIKDRVFTKKLQSAYGGAFITEYTKLVKDKGRGFYKCAIQVDYAGYEEFRKNLKTLGHSSRCYKKTRNWIWISDEDVIVKAKLLGDFKVSVNLLTIEADRETFIGAALDVNAIKSRY